jgi:hypothetical protein
MRVNSVECLLFGSQREGRERESEMKSEHALKFEEIISHDKCFFSMFEVLFPLVLSK